jgi:hypothetical protein
MHHARRGSVQERRVRSGVNKTLNGTTTQGVLLEALPDRKIRLLLVDDDPDNLVSLEATLQGVADDIVSVQSWSRSPSRAS